MGRGNFEAVKGHGLLVGTQCSSCKFQIPLWPYCKLLVYEKDRFIKAIEAEAIKAIEAETLDKDQ